MKKFIYATILVLLAISNLACKKFLDEKPDQSLAVPSTVQDLEALMDALPVNQREPLSDEVSSDDYYVTSADFANLPVNDRNMYTWQKEHLFENGVNEWFRMYSNVYRANQVLYNIDKIVVAPEDRRRWEEVRGHAAFVRGRVFLQALSLWAVAYTSETADKDPGIPIRLNPDFNIPSTRASVAEGYAQVISDLKLAIPLLPVIAGHPLRPNKAAAAGLLARTYLWMRQYDSCNKYADLSLGWQDELSDFSELDKTAIYPYSIIGYNNPELLVHYVANSVPRILLWTIAKMDSLTVNSYEERDLRKQLYFEENTGTNLGTFQFTGSYNGNMILFRGLATDEVLLMRAECRARSGDVNGAISDLNRLRENRWDESVVFVPLTAADAVDALKKVLTERRKELIFRGTRWMDIKRLNREGAGIVLRRMIDEQEYVLHPNDKKYALPIPEDVILASGMPQNER